MNGFLFLDKPRGITSAKCVYQLRSRLGIKKIGHCGTLDPLATGLLPICIGEATKFSNYTSNLDKIYEVGIKFGTETDTGDITGEVVAKDEFNLIEKDLKLSIQGLIGLQNQIPPMYSALKIKGKPLYYWARKGVYLNREPRTIDIKNIDLIEVSSYTAKLRVTCSKGTYIRSLVEKLGKDLGTFATMKSLRRLNVGKIKLDYQACSFEESNESLIEKILPCDVMLKEMEKVVLNLEDAKKVRNGLSIDYNAQLKNKGLVRIYTEKSLFIGIGEVKSNKILPKRLLSTDLN